MSRKVFKVWDYSRTIKKCLVSEVDLEKVIKRANDCGIEGQKLVLEEDGTQIEETEALEYFIDKAFLLLKDHEVWTPALFLAATASQSENFESLNAKTSCEIIKLDLPNYSDSTSSSPLMQFDTDETLSMSSSILSSSSCENVGLAQSKILFTNFKINWNKLPQNILDLLEKQQKIDKYFLDLVHFIVDDMRAISYYIPTTIFRRVAQDALSKYPISLGLDYGTGEINLDPENLTAKFVYHNNYLNRKNGKRSAGTLNVKPSIVRKLNSLKESCPNWLGESDEDDDSLERKRVFLKENFAVSNLKPNEQEKIDLFFDQTFGKQRKFLNNIETPPTISIIQEKWPHLLDPCFAKKHFNNLMNKSDISWKNLEKYVDKIIERKKDSDLSDCHENKYYTMLIVLTKHFKEEINHIVEYFEIGTNIDDINPKHNFPWIAAIEINLGTTLYYIFIETRRCTAMKTLEEALELTLIYFFNFNMCYPKESSLTLQSLQNLIGIADTFGRSKKKTLGNKSKVHSFLSSIINF